MDGGGGENEKGKWEASFLRAVCTLPEIGSILARLHILSVCSF